MYYNGHGQITLDRISPWSRNVYKTRPMAISLQLWYTINKFFSYFSMTAINNPNKNKLNSSNFEDVNNNYVRMFRRKRATQKFQFIACHVKVLNYRNILPFSEFPVVICITFFCQILPICHKYLQNNLNYVNYSSHSGM